MPQPLIRAAIGPAVALPLMAGNVAAGFPSPADDYVEAQLDLNDHLIQHPAATYFIRATGESMTGAGIHPGDLLVVDRAEPPSSGRVVIAAIEGELLVKRLIRGRGRITLPERLGSNLVYGISVDAYSKLTPQGDRIGLRNAWGQILYTV